MAQQQTQPDPDQLYESYGRNLYKTTGEEGTDDILDILSADMSANNSTNVQTSATDVGGGVSANTAVVANGSTQAGKSTFDNTVTGYILGVDPATGLAKFYIGNSSRYLNWTGTQLIIAGDVQIGNTITVAPGDSIQSAITTLTSTGGTVFLEAGTYTLSASITMAAGVSLVGAGGGKTILDFANGAFGIVATSISNFVIQDLQVHRSKVAVGSGGINITTCSFFTIRGVETNGNQSSYGLLATDCTNFTFDTVFSTGDSAGVTGTTAGIGVINTTVGQIEVVIINCEATGNENSGILVEYFPASPGQSGPLTLINCHADGNTGSGYFVVGGNGTSYPTYIGCTANGNGLSGFFTTMDYVSFTSCRAIGNSLASFFCNGITTGTFIGCDDVSNGFPYDLGTDQTSITFVGNSLNGVPYNYPWQTSLFTPRQLLANVALSDVTAPALDASLGNIFTLVATGNRTIAVPSNAQDGQEIVIRHTASGGSRTLALNAGAGGFSFGTTITGLSATSSGKTDYITCRYNATASLWHVVEYVQGY